MRNVPANRTLLDRPQRLGCLPTIWFWSDLECQRLVVPLIALTVPFGLAAQYLIMTRLGLAPTLVFSTLWPYLVMGFIERHIRNELRRRATERPLAPPAGSAHPPQLDPP